MRPHSSTIAFAALFLLLAAGEIFAQARGVAGKVIDENGLAVGGARLTLKNPATGEPVQVTTDEAGRFLLPRLPLGTYEILVEKIGFYAFSSADFQIGDSRSPLEITLAHKQEFEETVNVTYSAPVIDRQEISAQTTLTSEEIIDLPFNATHDFRNALPLLPGVVKDNRGRVHLNGGGEDQAYYSLDGFNLTSPVSGILENRISVDAIRAVRIETSRYSAEYGKGSAGVLALETSRGDDHFRFSSTNFLPSYEFHNGLALSNWNPRATFSGPIRRGRAWYFNALDLQYDLNIVDALPSTANTNRNWFGSNLTRLQFNLTNRNILTTGFLVNFQNSRHLGLSPLDPVETSRNRRERFFFFNIKDQAYLASGWVLETGAAWNKTSVRDIPLGEEPYRITPVGRSGNYFRTERGKSERIQGLVNVLSPSWAWHGTHTLKFGLDINRIYYRQLRRRRGFDVRRLQGSLARRVDFEGAGEIRRDSSEFSAYVQDRWSPRERLLLEAGLRLDWDQIIRQTMFSPRLALTWGPARMPESKLSAGVGVFRDSVNLALIMRALDQERFDTFYLEDGRTVQRGPISSRYEVDEAGLKSPFYLNWSLGWEQRLPGRFYLKTSYIWKRGRRGLVYDQLHLPGAEIAQTSVFRLRNLRSDRYSYVEFTLSRTFVGRYPWMVSYARSSARSTAVLDFSLDNPVFGLQGGGPLDWDAPNRLISWALLPTPFLEKYTLSYFLEWHSGLPFNSVSQSQQLVGAPNSRRFPEFFNLNLHMERRFKLWRAQWALRAGFNNIIGRRNPTAVINNLGSHDFGRFSGGSGRVFTGRIRFLGRN